MTDQPTTGRRQAGGRQRPRRRLRSFRRSRGAWRVLARSEIDRLADELKLAVAPSGVRTISGDLDPEQYVDAVKGTVREHLDKAEKALAPVGTLQAVRDWYSGAALEDAWLNIHRASEALLMIQSPASMTGELVQIDAAFRAAIEPQDPRYVHLAGPLAKISQQLLVDREPDKLTGVLRSELKAVRSVANVASDTAHETVRRWRNLLLIGGLVLTAFAVGVTVVHAFVPGFFSLAPAPPVKQVGDAVEPWQVALVGSLGGALAGVLALNRFSGFTDPAGLPVLQALLRVPTAAVTSLIGVLLMQTSTLDVLRPQNGATVLAYAFIFGYAQEPFLRAVDRRAGNVLNPARSKDEPAKTIPPAVPGALTPPSGNVPGEDTKPRGSGRR